MCRIAGIFDASRADLVDTIHGMIDSMRRGGPDDEGVWVDELQPLALGHRRLALIDLTSAGHQPMDDVEAGLTIVFNGEIYNYREIRAELTAAGHVFATASDTEVILKAYSRWGEECFARFNGMFALVIYDERRSRLVMARDHAGIKPLYYSLRDDRFYFASEIRAFKAARAGFRENSQWRLHFLAFGHLPEPVTTLEHVQPLPKGHFMVVSLPDLAVRLQAFAKFEFRSDIVNRNEATASVRASLSNAVARHMISDAPIGLFLSGGVDSSALTLLAKPVVGDNLTTLSIAFSESAFSERPYQQLITAITRGRHEEYEVRREHFDQNMPEVMEAMDQPTIDGINSWFISYFARQAGLKAVLAGHGADELFGGYSTFGYGRYYRWLARLPRQLPALAQHASSERLRKLGFLLVPGIAGEYLTYRGLFTPRWIAQWLDVAESEVINALSALAGPADVTRLDDGSRISWIETNLYLQNQLLRDTDFMSMWHGLEVRVPFLDRDLMQLLHHIEPSVRFGGSPRKRLLIDAMGSELPRAIWDRPKQGFTFPFAEWMRDSPIAAPSGTRQAALHAQFRRGNLTWSRYWCALLADRFAVGVAG
jgi:asparagine synthase (glutamine-hydrolysing)